MIFQRSTVLRKLLGSAIGFAVLGLAACAPPEEVNSDSAPPASAPIASPDENVAADDSVTEAVGAIGGDGTMAEIIAESEAFSTLEEMIVAADWENILAKMDDSTFFAPTDEAFAALDPETIQYLLQPENKAQLQRVLGYHLIPQNFTSPDVAPREVETIAGEALTIANVAGELTVNGAIVVQRDIIADNGVIHAINAVLLPPELAL